MMISRAFKSAATAGCLVLLITGCATARGPTKAYSTEGILQSEGNGLIADFRQSEKAAASDPENAGRAARMLETGLSVVSGNCKDYFDSAGKSQKWIAVTRDVVGLVGTIGGAALALHDSSTNAIANLTLASGFALAATDVYTKNFLFAADNISAVKELVTRAMDTHAEKALTAGPFTYQSAAQHIIDNQYICSHPSILALAREAIRAGKIEAAASTGGADSIVALADQKVYEGIADKIGVPSSISSKEALALWWLLIEGASQIEARDEIRPALTGLGNNGPQIDANGLYAAWEKAREVRDLLRGLPPQTRSAFATSVAKAREALIVRADLAREAAAKSDTATKARIAANKATEDLRNAEALLQQASANLQTLRGALRTARNSATDADMKNAEDLIARRQIELTIASSSKIALDSEAQNRVAEASAAATAASRAAAQPALSSLAPRTSTVRRFQVLIAR
jgi:hypothetical protein